jgi:hypothetical protein
MLRPLAREIPSQARQANYIQIIIVADFLALSS